MTDDFIYVFALVALAGMNVVLVLLIFSLRHRLSAMAGQCERFERRFTTVGIKLGELTKASPVNLAAEVVSLSDAVARLRATHQRFQGRFDQYMGQQREEVENNFDGSDDPRWRALMRSQQQAGNGGT